MNLNSTDGNVEILYDQKRVMLYVFGTNQLKPYVKELYSLDGRNILLDAPPDHLHHHGLMYAITVNGINFWEETDKSGIEYVSKILGNRVIATDSIRRAEFSHQINWIARTDRINASDESHALLVEKRTLKLQVVQDRKIILLEWIGVFKVGEIAEKVVLSGADYHGLGMRFVRDFDKVARYFNPDNLPYPTGGRHDLIETPWSAVHSIYREKPITAAIFTHQDTAGNSIYFSMTEPFAYLSATQGINKKPLVYSKGQSFTIRYLVLVSENELNMQDLNQIRKNWIEGMYER